MKEILREALDVMAAGKSVALSTIISASGSFPMSRRAKMLVLPDGTLRGTIGGGCLEAEVHARGRDALAQDGSPVLSRFVLTEEDAAVDGLVCGGTVEILTEVLGPGPVEPVLVSCLEMITRRQEGVLVTSLGRREEGRAGKLLVRSDGPKNGSLGGGLDEAAERLAAPLMGTDAIRAEILPDGSRLFLETIEVAPAVILFGGGHVSGEVARVAKMAGFRVVVVDDRPSFATLDRHPEADETHVLPFDDVTGSLRIDPHTYLVVVTRGHQHDEKVIRQALRTRAAYVGMIGSRRKVALTRKKLAAEGFSEDELSRLHAPIGLEIGADTPGEIAVSIVAELIAVRRRGGSDRSMTLSGRSGA